MGYQRQTNICNKNGERKQSSLQSITGESKGKRNDLDRTSCENVVWVYTGAIQNCKDGIQNPIFLRFFDMRLLYLIGILLLKTMEGICSCDEIYANSGLQLI